MRAKSQSERGIIQKKNKTTGKLEWYARIVRISGEGKKREFTAKASSKAEARRLRDELITQHSQRGEKAIEGSKLLFRQVAEIYRESKLHQAEYHGEGNAKRKIGGVRSLASSLSYLKNLLQFFGAKPLKDITYADLEEFKRKRLKTPTKRGARSIADVNRNLALLKSIMKFAKTKRWLQDSPFEHGAPLISMADETRRERVLSRLEETALLEACSTKSRLHLKPIIITALDTAMRKGELLKLKWKDVNFAKGTISVLALNTKTARARIVGMTDRVSVELQALWQASTKEKEALVFGVSDNFKRSFAGACKDAQIDDLHFHDLRHTAITRLIAAGLPPMQIMKVSGHTQINTFARYINPQEDAVKKIAEALTQYQEVPASETMESMMVN